MPNRSDPKVKILVVEDENIVAMDIERGLKKMGYDVVAVVNNGREALLKVEKFEPDLILMDVQLKGAMDGVETAARINDRFKIPVIFLTAFADKATIQRAKGTEPYAYVLKPFEEGELHSAIEVSLNKHQATERALLEKDKQFKLFIDSIDGYAIFMLNPHGRIITWNQGAERVTGFMAENAIDQELSIFYTQDDNEHEAPARTLALAEIQGKCEEEGWRQRPDGTRYWARCVTVALRDSNGTLTGFGRISNDLTERIETEARLKEAVKVRETFLHIASHELKTPLTPLSVNVQMLDRLCERGELDRLSIETMRKIFKSCSAQIGSLTALIEELLDFSRISENILTLNKEDFDLADLVRSICDRYEPQLAASKRNLVVNLPGESITGSWDRLRVEQVLVNLIANAVKYGRQGPIEVDLSRTDNRARLAVRDHGIGIQPKDQERIFERFERAVSVNSYGGLGLGLYIVREILNAHSGRIRVQSKVGEGSVFTVELPLDPSAN